MRILVLFCHPVDTSFHASLHRDIVATLEAAGHAVDDCDLYVEGFNPVMSREERLGYHCEPANREPVKAYVERLQQAQALVLCFPVWTFGPPAMLKGFFDRVLMPGVAFDLSDPAHVRPALTNIRFIAGITTYGRPRWMAWYMGDPPRRIITRYLTRLTGPGTRTEYHAHYHMNVATPRSLAAFRTRVLGAMQRFGRS